MGLALPTHLSRPRSDTAPGNNRSVIFQSTLSRHAIELRLLQRSLFVLRLIDLDWGSVGLHVPVVADRFDSPGDDCVWCTCADRELIVLDRLGYLGQNEAGLIAVVDDG